MANAKKSFEEMAAENEEMIASINARIEEGYRATGGRPLGNVILDVEKKVEALDARIDALTKAIDGLIQLRG